MIFVFCIFIFIFIFNFFKRQQKEKTIKQKNKKQKTNQQKRKERKEKKKEKKMTTNNNNTIPAWSKYNERLDFFDIQNIQITSETKETFKPRLLYSKVLNSDGSLKDPTGLKNVLIPIMMVVDESTEGLGQPSKSPDGEQDNEERKNPDFFSFYVLFAVGKYPREWHKQQLFVKKMFLWKKFNRVLIPEGAIIPYDFTSADQLLNAYLTSPTLSDETKEALNKFIEIHGILVKTIMVNLRDQLKFVEVAMKIKKKVCSDMASAWLTLPEGTLKNKILNTISKSDKYKNAAKSDKKAIGVDIAADIIDTDLYFPVKPSKNLKNRPGQDEHENAHNVEDDNADPEDEEFCKFAVSAKRTVWSDINKKNEFNTSQKKKKDEPRVSKQIMDIYNKGPSRKNEEYEKLIKLKEQNVNNPNFVFTKEQQAIFDLGANIENPFYDFAVIVVDHASDSYGDKVPSPKSYQSTEFTYAAKQKKKNGTEEIAHVTVIKPFEKLLKKGDMATLNVALNVFIKKATTIGVTFYYNTISLEYTSEPSEYGKNNRSAASTQMNAFLLVADATKKHKKKVKTEGTGTGEGNSAVDEEEDEDEKEEIENEKRETELIKSLTIGPTINITNEDNNTLVHSNSNNNNNQTNDKDEKEEKEQEEKEEDKEEHNDKEKEKEHSKPKRKHNDQASEMVKSFTSNSGQSDLIKKFKKSTTEDK
jgi:hypothetical protein